MKPDVGHLSTLTAMIARNLDAIARLDVGVARSAAAVSGETPMLRFRAR
jgi:hypothetical protein